ncbi:hypothetical protein ACRALDRAFT_213467 [Sodiomyces alcalophilus JCM 7366]|uniref:uncharacterized protein n=1 Tax=Sodiomyces alcalophilus JCM 7366 TaxID=591952 RepID=UPI0039B3C4ED
MFFHAKGIHSVSISGLIPTEHSNRVSGCLYQSAHQRRKLLRTRYEFSYLLQQVYYQPSILWICEIYSTFASWPDLGTVNMAIYYNDILPLTLALFAAYLTNFDPLHSIISVFICLNLKVMPLAYTARLAPSLARLFLFPAAPPPNDALFQPLSTRSRASMLECDVNLHKSNSTYLADLDTNCAALLSRLLARPLRRAHAGLVLGGVDVCFRREIRPFQTYETHSRVLAWDRKWIYVLSYHARPGVVVGEGDDDLGWLEAMLGKVSTKPQGPRISGAVFTVSISKYVAKAGRRTVSPGDLFEASGLLGSEDSEIRRQQVM